MAKKEKNILNDIMQYCAKSEHCTRDVIIKLQSWKVEEGEIDKMVEQLKNENFINDARYAKAFVNDKWKLDRWGKKKIRHQLQLKNIEEPLIEIPLDAIDHGEYEKELDHQLLQKERELKEIDKKLRTNRLYNFAVNRGFEEDLILKWLQRKGYIWK